MLLADRYGLCSCPAAEPGILRIRVQSVIDLKLLREDPDAVRRSGKRSRGEDPGWWMRC